MPSKLPSGPVILNNTPLAPLFDQLLSAGLYLAPELVEQALELAGEK